MGTEDERALSVQGRATAAAGAAVVAAAIVNPLDVIKTRIQAQALAAASGRPLNQCTAPNFQCVSTLYEHAAARRTLRSCAPELQHPHQQRPRQGHLLQRSSHTLPPEAAPRPCGAARAPAAANADGAAAAAAAAPPGLSAAVPRRWGITEGPIPIRRTPASPPGWPAPAPGGAAGAAAARTSAALAGCECAAAAAAAAGGGGGRAAAATAAAAAAAAAPPPPLPTHSMWEAGRTIAAREGLPVLWRGTSASLLIAVPMVGIYMPLYDALLSDWAGRLGSAAPVAAGTAARTAACFCVAPFELLRTRLQAAAGSGVSVRSTVVAFLADHQPHQQPAAAAAAAAAQPQHPPLQQQQPQQQQQLLPQRPQQQGQVRPSAVLRAVPRMWTGFSATLVRDVPFSALYWAMVEPLRQAMLPRSSHWSAPHWPPHEEDEQRRQQQQQQQERQQRGAAAPVHHTQLEILVANMASGFVAGGAAAGATTPFDVAKTRMQVAPAAAAAAATAGGGGGRGQVWAVLADVYRRDGAEGLFAGVKPRAYRAAPACAIVISVYELLKAWLTPP